MWYRASSFPSEVVCRKTWRDLQQRIQNYNIDMFTVSLIYRGSWCVVALNTSDRSPSQDIQDIVQGYLNKGTPLAVDTGALQTLYNRHLERRQHATYKPTKGPGLQYEGHHPLALPYDSLETNEQQRQHRAQVIDSLTKRGYPFLEVYALYYKSQIEQDFYNETVIHPYALKMGEIALQQLIASNRYMFTDSARAMHKAVTNDATYWITPVRDTWIEQDIPQDLLPGVPAKMKALSVKSMYPASRYEPLPEPLRGHLQESTRPFRDTWSISVLDEHAYFQLTLMYDALDNKYHIAFDHACPYGKCETLTFSEVMERYGIVKLLELDPPRYYREIHGSSDSPSDDSFPLVLPCDQCLDNSVTVTRWLHTAMRQIHYEYALSATPSPFPVKDINYTDKQVVPRHHGKGKPKEKQVIVSVPYTYVTYDVSVTPLTSTTRDMPEAHTMRLNWLALHGKEDLIYEKRPQADIKRHYRLPRYQPLINRVKQGEIKSTEGEEYQLIQEGDSSVVIGTVRYPNGRYVPMLKPEAKKQIVYKRVVASQYKSEKLE